MPDDEGEFAITVLVVDAGRPADQERFTVIVSAET